MGEVWGLPPDATASPAEQERERERESFAAHTPAASRKSESVAGEAGEARRTAAFFLFLLSLLSHPV